MTEPDEQQLELPFDEFMNFDKLERDLPRVAMYLDEEENTLTIEFGKPLEDVRNVQMVLNNDAEKEIVQAFLGDPNTWAVFLNALSQPLQEHA